MSSQFHYGEPLSASKLNSHSAKLAQMDRSGHPGSSSKVGSSLASLEHNLVNTGFWVRATAEVGPTTITYSPGNQTRQCYAYSWEAIRYDDNTQNWVRDQARWGNVNVDPLVDSDPTQQLVLTPDTAFDNSITSNRPDIVPYHAVKCPVTHKMIVSGGGGTGQLDTSGKDIQLLLLGTYDEYKDCSGVPVKPPTYTANGTDFCAPPYAWAAYKICGYKYKKLFDMRSYGKWATELNGGGAPALRRLYPAMWGWDTYTGGQPQSSDVCAGVRFMGFSSQATLSCTCPTWLSNVTCFKITVKYKTQAEVPCDPESPTCPCTNAFWSAIPWGETIDYTLCEDSGCLWQGGDSPFSFTLNYQEIPRGGNECYWGPNEIDPCFPCDGFGRFALSINRGDGIGGNNGNFYSGYRIDIATIHGLVQDCTKGPIALGQSNFWAPCPNVIDSIKISCCSSTETANCPAPTGGGGLP